MNIKLGKRIYPESTGEEDLTKQAFLDRDLDQALQSEQSPLSLINNKTLKKNDKKG